MNKLNRALLLVFGILLLTFSFSFDAQVSSFFKDMSFWPLDLVLSIISNSGVVAIVMLAFPSLILYKKNKKLVCFLWLTSITSFLLALIAKLAIQRQRPIGLLFYPFVGIIDYSFPSHHSMVAFSLLPMLSRYLPKYRSFWIAFAILVAFTRVYFNFHFLSDVVFGALTGYFVGNFMLKLYKGEKLWGA
ncbi:MAG: phosphatase PAP2 family protein [Nanoarchaeota archaeon]